VARLASLLVLITALAAAALWYYEKQARAPFLKPATADRAGEDATWLDALASSNPREAEAAAGHVEELGSRALPLVRATLGDPGAETERRKAALKACALLGQRAAPLVPEVAAALPDPALTAEAAVALSFMGRTAFGPLREALSSEDPVLRREALRSIGKLKERAPLDSATVMPLLIDGMADDDPGVRAVSATYLGIIHEDPEESVPALIDGLQDEAVEVRRASATALGSFGGDAQAAIPALRRASADQDPDVAREAGRSLVKLKGSK
jgi:HEAT repeat protein